MDKVMKEIIEKSNITHIGEEYGKSEEEFIHLLKEVPEKVSKENSTLVDNMKEITEKFEGDNRDILLVTLGVYYGQKASLEVIMELFKELGMEPVEAKAKVVEKNIEENNEQPTANYIK